jgi:type IV pilus assembly protein PilA
MKGIFSKVLWLGRATTFCVGLSVILAVVFGVGATALAAVPGDPLRLGRINTIDRLTSLAGSVGGPLLKIDNDGGGPALALESNAGTAPMKVNAEAGKVTNLDADELDGKDSTEFYSRGEKVADSLHAGQADSATNAENANTLDGKDSTYFQSSNPCPGDTLFHEGACIEIIKRGPAAFANAEAVCLQADRRLPTVAELQTFRLEQDLYGAEFTSQVWFDANGASQTQKVMLVDQAGRQSVASGSAAFRCVAHPDATRSENNPLEAAAQSNLRNAAAAATACAADNNGSYANCGTIAQLEANGYQTDSNVTLVITTATETRWVAEAQHNSGGSAYRFDTATGQIVPIPRS